MRSRLCHAIATTSERRCGYAPAADAADDHHHSLAGHGPRVSAAQAPGPVAVVLAALRASARLLPGGERGPLHGGAAPGRRSGRPDSARRALPRLDQYVNDRPYVASSFMSVAIARVFGTALGGTCSARPDLAGAAAAARARGSRCFPAPAARANCGGCSSRSATIVHAVEHPLDEQFPEWGESRYFTVELEGELRLRELLAHLYVLVPVLDAEKHYWVGEARSREAAAPRRGLAGRAPRARADRQPLPEVPASRYGTRRSRSCSRTRTRTPTATAGTRGGGGGWSSNRCG